MSDNHILRKPLSNHSYTICNGELELSAYLGYNQYGLISVWLDDEFIKSAQSLKINFGSKENLVGKTITLIATAQDIQGKHNHTSLFIKLKDNTCNKQLDDEDDAPVNGGYVIYSVKIKLA
jgi:hypothetical protein